MNELDEGGTRSETNEKRDTKENRVSFEMKQKEKTKSDE